MVVTLDKVLKYVKPEDNLSGVIVMEGKKYKVVGLQPRITEASRDKMAMVTLSDLFFLEAPRTYMDVKWRVEQYALEVSFKLEPCGVNH